MITKADILSELALFKLNTGGLGSWITENSDDVIFGRLANLDQSPIPYVQLNQLLAFGHEAPVSEGFFRYYWLELPPEHPYNLEFTRLYLSMVGDLDVYVATSKGETHGFGGQIADQRPNAN